MCGGEVHEWVCGCGKQLGTDQSIPVPNRCEAYNPITQTCNNNPVVYVPTGTDVGECDECKSKRLAREAEAWSTELVRVSEDILEKAAKEEAEKKLKEAHEVWIAELERVSKDILEKTAEEEAAKKAEEARR